MPEVSFRLFAIVVLFVLCCVSQSVLRMSTFKRLKSQAIELGYTGEGIGRYVVEQQNIERQERALEREEKRRQEEREDQKRKEQLELEREKMELEREKREMEAKEQTQKFELAKLQAEKELQLARIAASKKSTSSCSEGECVDRPRLPAYKDGDDFASYLTRFERIAELLKVSREDYAVRLGALLSGKAAKIYTSLSSEIVTDYDLLKKSLLRSFCKTPDGFRVDFRSSKIQPGETYQQFSIQLGRHFEQWLESCGIEPIYTSLKDFMVLDQFLSSLLPDLRTFIKERGVRTLEAAVQLADDWSSARHAYPRASLSSSASKKHHRREPASTDSGSQAAKGDASTMKCNQCGHLRPKE